MSFRNASSASASPRPTVNAVPTPGDSGVAAMVAQGIKKAREKLIDLTLRNGMLNYRHSETSGRHVRIVDVIPRMLVENLSSEVSLDLLALPPVETIPRDEDTDHFRAALKKAKIIDPEWLAAEDARRAAGNRRRIKDKAAERSLRDRVRAELGMPEWRTATDPKVRAQELGIDPSYDLPASSMTRGTRGHREIQTLFFPDRLEPKLATIHGGARSLQEDAGISALYCTVGFLEWYDTDDVQTPAYAPLVLLPINMEKRVTNGEYIFSITGRDEDETTNVALKEKLRQHDLELPDYDPELGIDNYLNNVTEAVKKRPRWRVRRWATIGLFSFSRQAMWNDLNPENWPAGARPEVHELLQQIYGDAAVGESGTIAEVHDIDAPEIELKAPVLVTDADASQVSAVIDAAGGTSLVIQGPPGTGKSQTITNIIANAMWQGKSVLFVSEKMAALNVVKNRLDHMDLGLYCLEVHSAKASKAQVLHALRERMNAPRLRSNAQEIESARESLRQARQRLTEYATVMNSPAGSTGLTTHDVLWGNSTRAALPASVPPEALECRFSDPLSIDRFKLAELKGAGKALDDHAAGMGAFAEPAQQPWRGVGNLNLSRFDRQKAIDAATHWAGSLEHLHQGVNALAGTCSWPGLASIAEVNRAVQSIRDIPEPALPIDAALLPLGLEDACVKSLTSWSQLVLQADRLEADVEAICPLDRLMLNLERATRLLEQADALGVAEIPVEALAQLHADAQAKAGKLVQAVELMATVFAIARRDGASEPDLKAEAIAASFLHNVRQFPFAKSHYRLPRLPEDGVIEDIEAAQDISEEANAAAMDARFAEPPVPSLAAAIPPARELREAATVIQTTAFLGKLFGKDWRNAKAIWRHVFPGEKKIPRDGAARLKAAALWKEGLTRLDGCVHAKEAIGRYWNGTATPFDALVEVARWMRSVRNMTPLSESGAGELRHILLEGSSDDVATYTAIARQAEELNLIALFHACYSKQNTISATAKAELRRSVDFAALLKNIDDVGLRAGVTPRALTGGLAAYRQALDCRRRMAAETVAVKAVGVVAKENELERAASVKASLQYATDVIKVGLPASVLQWLLHPDHKARTLLIKAMAQAVHTAIGHEETARRRTDELLHLRADAWCGEPFEEAAIPQLLQKARKAAGAPDDLEKQIALLSTEEEATHLGLGDLISAWSNRGLRYEGVAWAVEAVFYRSAAATLMRDFPALTRHTGNTHEQVRKRFQQLDKELLVLNRRLVAAKLHTRPIPEGRRAQSVRDYTENQMLDHQVGLQKPRIALRRLFSNAGGAIRAYKPCIMMSPMSVAQYLEPGRHVFDLLIIDEASQMRPEDALGAMIRCAQAVIVGDPEQLPPSDFFVSGETRDEEEIEDAPEELILELGRRCWRPMRMLEVHYRSRHQSLIAYSNREFYEERLLVYPSPVLNDEEFGVTCHRVDGAYEAGQGRNTGEARVIVEEAAALMRKRIDRSIEIVAVNKAQATLIEGMMDELAAGDPDIQAYRQAWDGTLEEFFVKNLENVQGDERDFILISTVYGKTAEGVFHQNFGPINKAYGHRRLNVLFTRAKRRLALFTSLDHSQIVAEGKQRGVRVLKEYLEYASTGSFQHGRQTGQEPDSDFERWFLTRLKSAGYEAHPQVGVAKYRIDIGIIHPDKPGTYIVGLECDGATYHSSKSARDRDRLRQSVLEELNWRIHRVWSTDWYRDPEREFSRLVQNIERSRS